MAAVNVTGFQRARRLAAEKALIERNEVDGTNTPTEAESATEGQQEPINNALNLDELTKEQIVSELEARGIEFNKRDSKDTLKGLLSDAVNG